MRQYQFTVPLPPSDNALFANCRKGATFTHRWESKESKSFKREVGFSFMEAKLPTNMARHDWQLGIVIHMDDRRYAIRDLSNCFKALIDAIASYIGCDDRFLVSLAAVKVRDARNYAEVTLTIDENERLERKSRTKRG